MFQDEARIAANLLHPNVAQIYDIGVCGEHYYIAMEYVRGEDLRRIYNQEVTHGRSMPRQVAALIVMGAAAGLHYAHHQTALDGTPLQIVHRDVSPQNILVTYDGHVKLIDFGVAKAAGKLNQTRAGVLKGKYSYMSPEQASGDPVDARTDIFALGTTLYEITTGTRLFKRDNELETLHAVIACNVPAPSEVVPGYDAQLEDIVLKALAYDAGQRYQTAAELERDLESFLRGQKQPTHASSLAAYMQELFAKKLAENSGATAEPAAATPPEGRRPTPPTVPNLPADDEPTVATPIVPPLPAPPRAGAGDDEVTTVDLHAAPPTPRTTPPPAPERTNTHTPTEWHVDETVELTGSGRALDGDPAATFLPAQEAARAQRDAARAWRDAEPGQVGEVHAQQERKRPAADDPPSANGRRRRPGSWSAWLGVAGMVLGVAGLGVAWRRRVAQRAAVATVAAADANAFTQAVRTGEQAAGGAGAAIEPVRGDPGAAPSAAGPVGVLSTPAPAVSHPIPAGQAGLDVAAPLPLAVFLGGRYLGDTPLLDVAVAPGNLHVKLESRQEGLVLWRRLRLPRGESRRLQIESERGRLLVEAQPWAWVQRGLYPAAETPRDEQVWAGDYVLIVECPDGRRRQQTVQVHGQQTTRVQLDCR